MPDDLTEPHRGREQRDDLPPPDAPDAPWFIYRSGPGWVQGKPYSRQGWIALGIMAIGVIVPSVVIAILMTRGTSVEPMVLIGAFFALVGGSLAAIFTLMFKLGRRVP